MISPSKVLRLFGFLVAGMITICGGGVLAIYGFLTMYTIQPWGPSSDILTPFHEIGKAIITINALYPILLLGFIGFIWEVKVNGFLTTEFQSVSERKKQLRRRYAEQRDAWSPPEEDQRATTNVYKQLKETTNSQNETTIEQDLEIAQLNEIQRDALTIRGSIRNTSGSKTYRNIAIKIGFQDEDGTVVDTTIASTRVLPPQETWTFDVFPSDTTIKCIENHGIMNVTAKQVQ